MAQTRIKGPARRERLLDAAAQIVLEHGVTAVTMEAVALLNGVNRAMAYRYFKSRDGLLSELLDREYDRQTEQITAKVDVAGDLEGALRYAMRHWFQHGELFRRLATDTGPLAARAAHIRRQDALIWAEGMEKAFALPREPAVRLAAFMVGGSFGLFEARSGVDDERVIDEVVRIVIAAGSALQSHYAPQPASAVEAAG